MHKNLLQKYRYSFILLKELVITEFKLRYQGSFLGYLWSLLKPLFLFAILYFVFVYFLKIGSNIPDWPIAMLVGIVLWNFFAEITNNGLNAIVSRGDVIRKINFPKYVIILASSVSALINLFLNCIVIAIFMIISDVHILWSALISPFYVLEIFIFGVGLSFILSTINVRLRDTSYIWEIIMQALFYGSAILYPISIISVNNPVLAQIILMNPVAQAVQDIRHVLVNDANQTLWTISGSLWLTIIPFLIVIIVFIIGAMYFRRKSPYFAEDI